MNRNLITVPFSTSLTIHDHDVYLDDNTSLRRLTIAHRRNKTVFFWFVEGIARLVRVAKHALTCSPIVYSLRKEEKVALIERRQGRREARGERREARGPWVLGLAFWRWTSYKSDTLNEGHDLKQAYEQRVQHAWARFAPVMEGDAVHESRATCLTSDEIEDLIAR